MTSAEHSRFGTRERRFGVSWVRPGLLKAWIRIVPSRPPRLLLVGARLALLLQEEGDPDTISVVAGRVIGAAEGLALEWGTFSLPLDVEWLRDLRPVQEDVADIFQFAEVWTPVMVSELPADADPADLLYTGLSLPGGEK